MRSWAELRPRRVRRTARAIGALGAALLLVGPLAPAAAQELAVEVVNASEPTLCAESDNVYLKLISGDVRRFLIEAVHPAYVGTIVVDSAAPDFRDCASSHSPVERSAPRRVTIYEDVEWQLVGLSLPGFWRAAEVPVRVGARVETGLHLLQLWHRFNERAEEILVLYPADGYWRARPLPPNHLRWSAYGSSFLVGPVEAATRPFVALSDVAFEPQAKAFRLAFARGDSATVRLKSLDQDRIALDVAFDAPVAADRPFAALRSMYVTQTNADVAETAWRTKDARGWHEAPVMSFEKASAAAFWAGRSVPSRHNTSAPDMIFREFRAE